MTAAPLVWLPDAVDHLEHAVIDDDVVSAGSAGRGHVVAVCSASVLLCSLATPPARRCSECQELFAREQGHPEPRRGRLGRLADRLRRAR